MSDHQVMIDEGGVRHSHGDERRYFPFVEIAGVELRTRLLRDPIVVLKDDKQKEHVIFAGDDALEVHKALAGIHALPPYEGDQWPREGRDLQVWLESLTASDTYRTPGNVSALPLAFLADVSLAIEDRAAAAYLLVRFADGEDLIATAKIFASRLLPPLVNAAAFLADGGAAFADSTAVQFCAPADIEVWEKCRREATDRHQQARFEAKRQLDVEAEAARQAAAHEKRASRDHVPAAYRDMSKWIGKSWGI